MPLSRVVAAMQAAAAAAAAVVDCLFKARRVSSRMDCAQPEFNAAKSYVPAVSSSPSSPSSPSSSSSATTDSTAAAAAFAGASETLADEMSLCLTLLSKTTSYVFAIIEQLPDVDATDAADALLEGAAQATSSLQETTVRLADMYVDAIARFCKLRRNC